MNRTSVSLLSVPAPLRRSLRPRFLGLGVAPRSRHRPSPPRSSRPTRSLPRHAPGRDRHAAAVPAALRVVRRAHRRPRRARAACSRSGPARPRRMTVGQPGRDRQHRPGRAPRRHRRGRRPRPVVAHGHVGFGAVPVRPGPRSLRDRDPQARRAGRHAHVRGRRDRPGAQRRRPGGAGVCRRSAGRLPRHPQPHPHRPRRRRVALVAVRLRAHVEHRRRAGDAPQPHGVQGRHQQRRRRGHRAPDAITCGWRPPTIRRGCAAAATSSPAASACCSRSGTARRSPTRSSPSGGSRAAARPLGATKEHDVVNLTAKPDGEPVIPVDAPHPAGGARGEQRHPAPAARLLLHRRHRPGHQPARRRPLLHRVPARSARRVHPGAGAAAHRRAQRVHPPQRHRDVRVPPGVDTGGYFGETLFD